MEGVRTGEEKSEELNAVQLKSAPQSRVLSAFQGTYLLSPDEPDLLLGGIWICCCPVTVPIKSYKPPPPTPPPPPNPNPPTTELLQSSQHDSNTNATILPSSQDFTSLDGEKPVGHAQTCPPGFSRHRWLQLPLFTEHRADPVEKTNKNFGIQWTTIIPEKMCWHTG